jgi:hypothetical protein
VSLPTTLQQEWLKVLAGSLVTVWMK